MLLLFQKHVISAGVPFFLITAAIGLAGLKFFKGESIDPNTVMQALIKLAVPPGFRGVIIAGMLSVVMSSADSLLNSASVSVVNDIVLPLCKSYRPGLRLARTVNFLTGITAVAIALLIPDILDILKFSYLFWSPVVLPPLICALTGVHVERRSFFIGAAAGVLTAVLWQFCDKISGVGGAVARA